MKMMGVYRCKEETQAKDQECPVYAWEPEILAFVMPPLGSDAGLCLVGSAAGIEETVVNFQHQDAERVAVYGIARILAVTIELGSFP
jgi:hypothetical protein